MVLCPYCLGKINKERHELAEVEFYIGKQRFFHVAKCPYCKQEITNLTVVSTIPFPDCVVKVKYIGLNSNEDANSLLKMMQ